jgi:hypothetical protein
VQVGDAGTTLPTLFQLRVLRQRERRENADDHDDEQEFDQDEAVLRRGLHGEMPCVATWEDPASRSDRPTGSWCSANLGVSQTGYV